MEKDQYNQERNGQPEKLHRKIGIEAAIDMAMDHYTKRFESEIKRRIVKNRFRFWLREVEVKNKSWLNITSEEAIYQLQEIRGMNDEEDDESIGQSSNTLDPLFRGLSQDLTSRGESPSYLKHLFVLTIDVLQAQRSPSELLELKRKATGERTPQTSRGISSHPIYPKGIRS